MDHPCRAKKPREPPELRPTPVPTEAVRIRDWLDDRATAATKGSVSSPGYKTFQKPQGCLLVVRVQDQSRVQSHPAADVIINDQ